MTRTTVTKTRKATTRPTQRVRSVVEAPPEGERGGCAGGRGVTVSVPYSTIELSPALHMPPEQGCVARSLPPAQYLPPFLGAGLLQSRRRYWMQSALQDDHDERWQVLRRWQGPSHAALFGRHMQSRAQLDRTVRHGDG